MLQIAPTSLIGPKLLLFLGTCNIGWLSTIIKIEKRSEDYPCHNHLDWTWLFQLSSTGLRQQMTRFWLAP